MASVASQVKGFKSKYENWPDAKELKNLESKKGLVYEDASGGMEQWKNYQ